MLFNDPKFFIFLIVVYLLYLVSPRRFKNPFLLIVSYVFYSFWDWRFLLLLALSTFIDYYFGLKIHKASDAKTKKRYMWFGIFNNLVVLGFFKYYNFFVSSLAVLLSGLGIESNFTLLNIILPVGISFYTFHGMSYVIDIYKGKFTPTTNFINYSLFVAYFPLLVAGPIERASHLLPQIENIARKITRQHVFEGLVLIFWGYVKKVMISDNIGAIADNAFANYQQLGSFDLITSLIIFSFQIYFDFSGYSDIGRGVSKLFGIELYINFNQPYLSQNISEFWKRWHISLSGWLQDYLYISLGGNRNGKFKTYRNIMITMLLGGLWHGPSWNFVIWGGLHGTYLIAHKFLGGNNHPGKFYEGTSSKILLNVLAIVLTYCLVLITWLPFRADSLQTTIGFISGIVNWTGGIESTNLLYIVLLFASILAIDLPVYISGNHEYLLKYPKWIRYIILIVGIAGIVFTMVTNQGTIRPFIYFQF